MSFQVFVRVARFVSVSLLLGAALVAVLVAWCLSSLALWLLRLRSRSVVWSSEAGLCLPGAPVRLCLPSWGWSRPLPRHQFLLQLEQSRLEWLSLGFGLPAVARVLVTPVRLCLPAAAPFSVGSALVAAARSGVSGCASAAQADLALRAEALSSVLVAAASVVSVPCAAEVVGPLCPFEGVSVSQLRRLAVSRGVRGVSRLRRAKLVALLS